MYPLPPSFSLPIFLTSLPCTRLVPPPLPPLFLSLISLPCTRLVPPLLPPLFLSHFTPLYPSFPLYSLHSFSLSLHSLVPVVPPLLPPHLPFSPPPPPPPPLPAPSFCHPPATCVVTSSRALNGCISLASHKELKDLNMEGVRMMLLDDGANPCKLSPSYFPSFLFTPPLQSPLLPLQGRWPPVTYSMMPTRPRGCLGRLSVLVLDPPRPSPSP